MDVKLAFLLFAAFGVLFAGCLGGKTDAPPTPPANTGANQTGIQTPSAQPGANEPGNPPAPPSGNEQPPALPPDSGEQQQGATPSVPPAPGTSGNLSTPGAGGPSIPPVDEFAGKYTFWDVNGHDTNDACWAYSGNSVYDLTGYITKHPGGMYEIFSQCASNVTQAYKNATGPGGVPLLPYLEQNYKIGELVPGDAKLHPNE